MKKFFKVGCLSIIGLVVLIVILGIAFSGEEEKVSTGTETSQSEETNKETSTDDGSKIVDATSITTEVLGLKVGLGEVKILEDKIQVGINLENTNENEVNFHPDLGSAVIGDMQLDANWLLTEGDIGGEIQGGVKQEGILEFLVPEGKTITVKDVTEIKLMLDEVISGDYMSTENVELTVPVK